MSETLVEFRNVAKHYGQTAAVKDFSLTIAKGEFVALMGPSGCGKTTSLRMLAGLERPSAGDIVIAGERMNDVPANERDTPMVWQSLALFPFLNVQRNVEFGLRMRNIDAPTRRERAREWLHRLGLEGFESRRVDQLSGGQRQRVALARALVTEPEMLLLDEPLSALDAHLVVRMQGVLTRLQRDLGITFVYVTHSQSEAFAMADRVVIMDSGSISQIGAPKDIYRAPANRFVAEFVGCNNLFSGPLRHDEQGNSVLSTSLGDIALPSPPTKRDTTSICVAADRMHLTPEEPDTASRIPCALISEEFAGAGVIVYLEAPDTSVIKVQLTESAYEALDLRTDATLWVSWSPEAAHYLED
ncbi:MAG: ABC transporter ATP-binding protein [Pseudomonadota bacterium]